MKISQEVFNNLYQKSLEFNVYTFNADFASAGAINSYKHSKEIYSSFLKVMEDIDNPIFIVSREVCGYFITNTIMAGLFGKIDSIVKVGELLHLGGMEKYKIYSSNDNYCGGCGSPIREGECEYCGSNTHINQGIIDIYTVPRLYDRYNPNMCLIVNYDLTNSRMLQLINL